MICYGRDDKIAEASASHRKSIKKNSSKKSLDNLYCAIHSVYHILYGEWY